MPVVMVTPEAMRETPGEYVDILKSAGFEIRYPRNEQFARGLHADSETIAELQGIDATIAGGEHYRAEVLQALPQLKVVARAGVGYDRVDVEAVTAHNIALTITPTTNHEAVAELTLALLFALTKSIVVNDRLTRAGGWPRENLLPIRGNTFGIVGLGRIGRSTAVRALAMGMQVIATDAYADPTFVAQHGIEVVPFDDLLGRSDFVSVHCPHTPETDQLFDREAFAKMKSGSMFINTARGKLVNEDALYEALTSGHLRGAGLDVFEQEPPNPDNPLLTLDSVVVSPHKAGTDEQSAFAMIAEAADCIVKLSRNEWPENAVVNDGLRHSWDWATRRA
ncbi:MAG: lactate dehydrogenase [Blastopirellula sp.]|nr:lactate dehydrogenase [Blastopirellula sp.]